MTTIPTRRVEAYILTPLAITAYQTARSETSMNTRRHILQISIAGAGGSLLGACGGLERGTPVPTGQTQRASVLGLPNERFFPVGGANGLDGEFVAAAQRQMAQRKLKIGRAHV